MGETIFGVILAILVVVIAGIILRIYDYFSKGPNLKVKHINRQLERQEPLTYMHVILIENKGKRAGSLIDIVARPDGSVKQSYLMVEDITNGKVAPTTIEEKRTVTLFLDCFPIASDTRYWIDARYQKSIFNHTYEKRKRIWSN